MWRAGRPRSSAHEAVPLLLIELHSGQKEISAAAVDALLSVDPHAEPARVLSDPRSLRSEVCSRSGRRSGRNEFQGRAALPDLLAQADSDDYSLHKSVNKALAHIDRPAAGCLPSLIQIIGGKLPNGAAASADARSRAEEFLGRLLPDDDEALHVLMNRVPDPEIGEVAAVELVNTGIKDRDLIEQLGIMLKAKPPVNKRAARILAASGPAAGVVLADLIAALSDSDSEVLTCAANTIAAIGRPAISASAPSLPF